MAYALNFPWSQVNNFVAKTGVGAYLTASATTPVTTSYTRLLGTFNNVELEDFIINGDDKLEYSPDDGLSRTFKLLYSCQVEAPNVNDIITTSVARDTGSGLTTIPGSEVSILCRVANSPYAGAMVLPVELDPGDVVEVQVKGDSSFTMTTDAFNTVLMKEF